MTDAEKDREAVEWLAEHVAARDHADPLIWTDRKTEHCRRILALAKEALAMRERGVWAYWVEGSMASDGICGDLADAVVERDFLDPGARIIPLYAGEPVEVEE